ENMAVVDAQREQGAGSQGGFGPTGPRGALGRGRLGRLHFCVVHGCTAHSLPLPVIRGGYLLRAPAELPACRQLPEKGAPDHGSAVYRSSTTVTINIWSFT